MSIEANVQIAKDFFAAIGRGDKQGLRASSAEDIEWIIPGEGEKHPEQVAHRLSR